MELSVPRGRGRPRSAEVDAAILEAALGLLIEHGVEGTAIEQVAKRAGVTRPTVYRRFPDKNQMLVAAIHMAHVGQPDLPEMPQHISVEQMLSLWAQVLWDPRRRALMRRLISTLPHHPELSAAYWDASLRHRDAWVRAVLKQAHDQGKFPADADLGVIQQILNGAVAAHVTSYPDTSTETEIETYLIGVLRQTCYRRGSAR